VRYSGAALPLVLSCLACSSEPLHRGLVANERPDLARTLTERTRAAVTAQLRRYHQFRELYDADDATRPNASMPNYCWSALVAEMMLEDP